MKKSYKKQQKKNNNKHRLTYFFGLIQKINTLLDKK